ncbi:MAG: hypothetical protein HQK53_15360, partial [Oligoflexia bacterium]|nr:hypothetical protein [Oligoflexia bacterium]
IKEEIKNETKNDEAQKSDDNFFPDKGSLDVEENIEKTAKKTAKKTAEKTVEKKIEKKNAKKHAGLEKEVVLPIGKDKKKLGPLLVSADNGSVSIPLSSAVSSVGELAASNIANKYRDFRYGASIVWDYPPEIPSLKGEIDFESKTAEYYYELKNRDIEKSDKETHLQLSINLYRSQKWGLMSKSIDLFKKKYGNEDSADINNFLQANALLRDSFIKKEEGPKRMAIAMYSSIVERTQDYELKRGLLQYLINYMIIKGDFLRTMHYAKALFVEAKSNFEDELEEYSAIVMLHCLAKLGQVEKVGDLVQEKAINVLIPKQLILAYEIYSNLFLDKSEKVVALYEKNKNALVADVHYSILFNVGEAYFRLGDYTKSQELFSALLKGYSHLTLSGWARLRIALMFEISTSLRNEDVERNLEMYKEVIDRTADPAVRYEAKLRYAGIRLARKFKIDDEDREYVSFLERKPGEEKIVSNNIKKLLWLLRLRIFINEKKYDEAFTYLRAIPLMAIPALERRIFEGDGAEIIFGLMDISFQNSDFGEVIRLWERYKEEYFYKVAPNPEVNFMAGYSYYQMGLHLGAEKILNDLSNTKKVVGRTYPRWVFSKRDVSNLEDVMDELRMVKLFSTEKWQEIYDIDRNSLIDNPNNIKLYYYQGIAAYKLLRYDDSVRFIEEFLVKSGDNLQLRKQEMVTLFEVYTESMYRQNDSEKFLKSSRAILSDLSKILTGKKWQSGTDKKSNKDTKMSSVTAIDRLHERLLYLVIETLFGDGNSKNYDEILLKSNEFISKYSNSIYVARIRYLNGMTKIKVGPVAEGEDILNKLLKDENVPNYVKELSKAELSSLKLTRQNI